MLALHLDKEGNREDGLDCFAEDLLIFEITKAMSMMSEERKKETHHLVRKDTTQPVILMENHPPKTLEPVLLERAAQQILLLLRDLLLNPMRNHVDMGGSVSAPQCCLRF